MFASNILAWDKKFNKRDMPWKGIKDPYKIWISEIILQQTRVEQGLKYFHALTNRYPTLDSLALADEQALFNIWQGLGYYSRCRNMLHTAKEIKEKYDGKFPEEYSKIIALKGIGPYTAAAIASFAFNKPYAVLDGNVVRILSRYFAIDSIFNSTEGKKEFSNLAQELISKKYPGKYNQALMDLGATICKPQNPLCTKCPLHKSCKAFQRNEIEIYPIKIEKKEKKHRQFHFFVFEKGDQFYIRKRTEKDIWKDLYTFPHFEKDSDLSSFNPLIIEKFPFQNPIVLTQVLTHQKIIGHFFIITSFNKKDMTKNGFLRIHRKDIQNYAFPRLMMSFFENYHYL